VDDYTRIQPVKKTSLALRAQATGEMHTLSGEVLIGREVECDIQLTSPQISRYHAKIFVSVSGLYIEDLQSSNGTYVNGKKVQSRTSVGLGDQIAFDDLSFRVTSADAGNADFTRIAAAPSGLASTQSSASAPAGLAPIADQPDSKRDAVLGTAGDKGKSAGFDKARTASDLEALLDDAGADLKAVSVADANVNPFGLSKRIDAGEDPLSGLRNADTPAIPLVEPPSQDNSFDVSDQDMAGAALEAAPEERELEPGAQSTPSVSSPAGPKVDDDATRYVSLNTLDHYVTTNEKYQSDLDIGSGPRFIVMTAPVRGKVFSLESGDDVKCWSIGRDDSADICIRDKAVSREHAWITKLDSLYQMRVNDDANCIVVNGESCAEADLRHGDRLQLGAVELVFKLDVHAERDRQTAGEVRSGMWAGLQRWWTKMRAK